MTVLLLLSLVLVSAALEEAPCDLCDRMAPYKQKRPWNPFCDEQYTLSDAQRDERLAALGKEKIDFIVWAMDATEDWQTSDGNPVANLLMHRRDEHDWLTKRGKVASCGQECTPHGHAQCVETMRKVYSARTEVLKRAKIEEHEKMLELDDDETFAALLPLLAELGERRDREIAFMANLNKRQGVQRQYRFPSIVTKSAA